MCNGVCLSFSVPLLFPTQWQMLIDICRCFEFLPPGDHEQHWCHVLSCVYCGMYSLTTIVVTLNDLLTYGIQLLLWKQDWLWGKNTSMCG